MKITRPFLLVFALAFQASYAQQVYKCSDSRSFWLIEKDSSLFIVRLQGKVQETEKKNVISVGSSPLQYVMVDKKPYTYEDSIGMAPLIQYALNESEYFSGRFNHKVNVSFEKAPVSSRDVLIWFFELLENVSKEVKNMVFAGVISGDKIFGLSSSQFPDQELEDVKKLLIDAIVTLKEENSKVDIVKLCEEK